jgi:hypothetical protein
MSSLCPQSAPESNQTVALVCHRMFHRQPHGQTLTVPAESRGARATERPWAPGDGSAASLTGSEFGGRCREGSGVAVFGEVNLSSGALSGLAFGQADGHGRTKGEMD